MLLSQKQIEFVRYGNHRWNFKGGATRSGKTYLDFRWMIPIRIRERIGKDGLTVILGVTKSTIERNVLEPMRNLYGDELVGTISSDNTVWLFGEKCYCLGAEKMSQVSKIRGASIKYCYGDEVADWSVEVFELLKSRLDKEYSCFDGTFNPQHPEHWLKKFLESDADVFSQTYTIDDNPFLPDSFKENLKKEYAGTVFYDRYILGLWTRAEGLVYPNFDKEKHTFDKPPFIDDEGNTKRGTEFFVSCDYGIVNPFSAHLWALYKGVAYCWKEYYFDSKEKRRQKTDEEHYKALESMIGDTPVECIVVDPSATSFKETIRRHDRFSVANAINDVIPGISTVATLINGGLMLVHKSNVNAIREFGMYSWDSDATEDAVIKEFDHAMDDIRYMCHTIVRREFDWLDWSGKR